MGLFSKEKPVVGLDIGSHAIKLVELSLHKEKYRKLQINGTGYA